MKSHKQVIRGVQFSGSGEQLIRDLGYRVCPSEGSGGWGRL